MLYNTGARVSEMIGVRVADVVLDGAACVHLHGKGRKQRTVPLWRSTVQGDSGVVAAQSQLVPASALLPNRDGQPMTRTNVTQRLALAVKAATPNDAQPGRSGASRRTPFATPPPCICCSRAWTST